MNKKSLIKRLNKWHRVWPVPLRMTESGKLLPAYDDLWILEQVGAQWQIRNQRTGHFIRIDSSTFKSYAAPDLIVLRHRYLLCGNSAAKKTALNVRQKLDGYFEVRLYDYFGQLLIIRGGKNYGYQLVGPEFTRHFQFLKDARDAVFDMVSYNEIRRITPLINSFVS